MAGEPDQGPAASKHPPHGIGGDTVTAVGESAGPVCHITTTGRVSGLPRRTEIWYLERTDGLYVLSGNGEDAD